MRADLHVHSVYSDGFLNTEDIIYRAKSAGVELIALTDHDTTLGSGEIAGYAESAGVKCVKGIEVSAYVGDSKYHTLGYNIDEQKFKPFADEIFINSVKRAEDIFYKLSKLGMKLGFDDVNSARSITITPVHVTHIARALVKKGYCKDFMQAFNDYLSYGKPAFSCILRPTPEETCEAIKYAGGFSSLAHPGRIIANSEELRKKIISMRGCGLGGIEVYYTTHTYEQTAYYKELAEKLGLIATGGSDTHGYDGAREIGKPVFYADKELLKRLGVK